MLPLLLLSVSLAAPVPKEVAQSVNVVAGKYILICCGVPSLTTFRDDGAFADSHYTGTWEWDPRSRVLSIAETEGNSWSYWSVVLDQNMQGKTKGGMSIHLKLKP